MKKIWKQRWIEALRSGKYKQGTHYLTQIILNGQHIDCCLGVLTKLVKEHCPNLGIKEEKPISGHIRYYLNEDSSTRNLLRSVKKEVGFNDYETIAVDSIKNEYITNLNDAEWTFEQLADLIEMKVSEEE